MSTIKLKKYAKIIFSLVLIYVTIGSILFFLNIRDMPKKISVGDRIELDSYLSAKVMIDTESMDVYQFSCSSSSIWIFSRDGIIMSVVSYNWNDQQTKLVSTITTCFREESYFDHLTNMPIYVLVSLQNIRNRNADEFKRVNAGDEFNASRFEDELFSITENKTSIKMYRHSCYIGCMAVAIKIVNDRIEKAHLITVYTKLSKIKYERSIDQLNKIIKVVEGGDKDEKGKLEN